MRLLTALLAACLLAGCAGMTEVIEKREALYAAKPLNASASVAMSAYHIALKSARADYETAMAGQKKVTVPDLIDVGISAANSNCRQWFARLSAADQRWEQGEANLNVAENAITGILGVTKAASSIVAGYGIAATALSGYNSAFKSSVLSMSDYDLQSKVQEIMADRAATLRADAGTMSYPQAVDALEGYSSLCTTQAAKAAAKSTLGATQTTVTPAGTLESVAK